MTRFQNKHVFITGGGTGIGFEVAKAFANEGANLTLAARNEIRVREAATQFPKALGVGLDVSNKDAIRSALKEARAKFGPVQILINNAGIEGARSFLKTDDDLWNQMLDVNLSGVFHMIREVLPEMVKAGEGRIINVASTAGLRGFKYTSAYCAAKHGVVGLTRALALELKGGVTVNAVCPGFTRTPMMARAIANITGRTGMSEEGAEAELSKLNEGGRVVEPSEVADEILNLAEGSENGQIVPITGE